MANVWKDPVYDGTLPGIKATIVEGKRGRILTLLYKAGGEGNHPTILLCHGFPGHEKNYDLAQCLRRMGFNVMVFHYSGSWGSDGDYSVGHCMEDAQTVLDYLLSSEDLGVDKANMYIIGHSLGGCVAANTFARNDVLKACVLFAPGDMCQKRKDMLDNPNVPSSLPMALEDGARWLNGTSAKALLDELEEQVETWRFANIAEAISNRPLLIVGGTKDIATPPETDQKPLVKKLDEIGKGNHKYIELDGGHTFDNIRIALIDSICGFMEQFI